MELRTNLDRDRDGNAVQALIGSGNRANITAGATTSRTTVPTGTAFMVLVRATDWIAINFGTSGVNAAVDATSTLFAPGEAPLRVPTSTTHFAVIRVGSSDVAVQLESLSQTNI